MTRTGDAQNRRQQRRCLFVMFRAPSTVRPFREGTPIYCPFRRTSSHRESNHELSRVILLHSRCATPAQLPNREEETAISHGLIRRTVPVLYPILVKDLSTSLHNFSRENIHYRKYATETQ